MTVPMGFSGNNNARVYEYDYDRTGRQVGMEVTAANVTSNSTLATASAGSGTEFYYDNASNRVKLITKSRDVYYFVYDPTASVPAVVYEAVDDGETTVTYLNARDPMGGLISRDTYEGAARTQSRTYHFDGLGSTRSLTDEDGVVTDSYTYDEWGNVTNHTGSTADNPYQYVGKLGYYTHYQEPDFEYLQLGVRYYDPGIGRFTQRDPAKDGVNWIIYAEDRPTVLTDPNGMGICWCPFIGRIGKLKIDCSCKDKIYLWVIPEDGTKPAFTPATCGVTYNADGFKINNTIYKIDGSTCNTIKCSLGSWEIYSCVNCLAAIRGSRPPYPVPAGTFGNEPPPGKRGSPVK